MQARSNTHDGSLPPRGLAGATVVGAGRHGTVFHGWLHDAEVAVKVPPHPEVAQREATALVHLRHPNIVDLVEHPSEGVGLVLEYCAGGTLADSIDGVTVRSVTEVSELMAPILSAVAHVHRSGWIHGDISPSNIGLRASGEPVVLDFAASRPADGSRILEGTVEYAGPLREAKPALDVRSCAAVALELFGPTNRWDDDASVVQLQLQQLIDDADHGREVSVVDLSAVLSGTTGPVLVRSGTIEFGDRPPPPTASPNRTNAMGSARRWSPAIVLAVVAVFAFFLSTEVVASATSADGSVLAHPSARPATASAEATLAGAGVSWSEATGELTSLGGSGERWSVGRPGDLAAVGRWNCTDDATLGVYRPSTGEWFTFSSWLDDAASSAPITLSAEGVELLIESTDSCDQPVVGG